MEPIVHDGRVTARTETARWSWSDAWVMAAIAAGKADDGESSLVGLIQAADRINHAILNHDEVQQAIRRLRNASLVAVSDTGFVLTEKGEEMAEEASRRGSGLATIDRLLKALNRQPVVDQPPWLLSEAAHMQACRIYIHGA
jgi:hypothetical protein